MSPMEIAFICFVAVTSLAILVAIAGVIYMIASDIAADRKRARDV